MQITRFLLGIAVAAIALPAAAQEWPAKPIRFIVPSAAGGAADLTARTFGEFLAARVGQAVVVDDRPGAGGVVGAVAAKNAAPDGYTFFISGNSTHAANQHLFKNPGYDPVKDFEQVGLFGTFASVAVVAAESPIRSIADLVERARAQPGKLAFGYYSSSSQIPAEMLRARAGIDVLGASYKNITQIITDLAGGQITFAFIDYLSAGGSLEGGRLRAIAVSDSQPAPAWPQVPTVAATYPGFEVAGWLGLSAPASTPAVIVQRVNALIAQAQQNAATRTRFERLGLVPRTMSPEQFAAFVIADGKRWAEWVRLAKIAPQ